MLLGGAIEWIETSFSLSETKCVQNVVIYDYGKSFKSSVSKNVDFYF